MFTKAVRSRITPKIAFEGAAGAGKTYSALLFARGYVGDEGKIAFIDTENGSASLYSNLTNFDVVNISPRIEGAGVTRTSFFNWMDFMSPIQEAVQGGYGILVIDSASAIWEGTLDLKTKTDITVKGSNSFTNWGLAKQTYANVRNLILQVPIPVVCCFRTKMSYVLEENAMGKMAPVKKGMAPIAAEDAEYDFSIVFNIDTNHVANISKSRCDSFDNDFCEPVSIETGKRFYNWVQNLGE